MGVNIAFFAIIGEYMMEVASRALQNGERRLDALEKLEQVAHEIEYANELCTAIVDVLIVLTLQLNGSEQERFVKRSQLICFGSIAAFVPAAQLVVYNSEWGGEKTAHYLEFAFDAASAAVSFWFCADSMLIADRLKLEIMLAPTDLSIVIDQKSRRSTHNHADGPTSPLNRAGHGPASEGIGWVRPPSPVKRASSGPPNQGSGYTPPRLVRGRDGVVPAAARLLQAVRAR